MRTQHLAKTNNIYWFICTSRRERGQRGTGTKSARLWEKRPVDEALLSSRPPGPVEVTAERGQQQVDCPFDMTLVMRDFEGIIGKHGTRFSVIVAANLVVSVVQTVK